MAELADALGSGPSNRKIVEVRLLSAALMPSEEIPSRLARRFPELLLFPDPRVGLACLSSNVAYTPFRRHIFALGVGFFGSGAIWLTTGAILKFFLSPQTLHTLSDLVLFKAYIVTTFLGAYLYLRLIRHSVQAALREELARRGIPVCLNCGYNMRGLLEPRCPECGQRCDARLLQGMGIDSKKQVPLKLAKTFPEIFQFDDPADGMDIITAAGWQTRGTSWIFCFAGVFMLSQSIPDLIAWMKNSNSRTTHYGSIINFLIAIFLLYCDNPLRHGRRWQIHNSLREELRRRGVRICLSCGDDMRDSSNHICKKDRACKKLNPDKSQ